MSLPGASGPGDTQPSRCSADGPVSPGRSVVDAVECNTARFVNLTEHAEDVTPTYLVLTPVRDRETTSLTRTDVFGLPELQNALAYFSRDTETVRVQTSPRRRTAVREHVAALRKQGSAFEFAGREFDLSVVVG